MRLAQLDNLIGSFAKAHGVSLLRISLGIVFLWFGALKFFDVSPVAGLVSSSYSFFPAREFMIVLGIWEMLVGLWLILKLYLRLTIIFLWLQMGGVFGSLILLPSAFIKSGNPLLLTLEGEFLVKNIVILAATLVIWAYEIYSQN